MTLTIVEAVATWTPWLRKLDAFYCSKMSSRWHYISIVWARWDCSLLTPKLLELKKAWNVRAIQFQLSAVTGESLPNWKNLRWSWDLRTPGWHTICTGANALEQSIARNTLLMGHGREQWRLPLMDGVIFPRESLPQPCISAFISTYSAKIPATWRHSITFAWTGLGPVGNLDTASWEWEVRHN